MLGNGFYWIFNMSILSSVVGLVIFLVRRIKGIPRRLAVLFWIIPFIRMVVPVAVNTKYSLMTLLNGVMLKTVIVSQPTEAVEVSQVNFPRLLTSYDPMEYKADYLKKGFDIAGLLWIVGCVLLLVFFAIQYVLAMRTARFSECYKDNIRFSKEAAYPAVYGVIKPVIIIPASYEGRELKNIILHEQTHIKRHDNLWRVIALITVSIHWFNPFAWVFLKAFFSDIELACDECAIKDLNAEEQKDYALTLLDSVESRSLMVSPFGGAKISNRIRNIVNFKHVTIGSAICFALLLVVISVLLLTNAA